MTVVVLAGVIGAAAGASVSHFVHPRWGASMTIQVGQVASADSGKMDVKQIENPLTVVDRFNTPGFRLRVLQDLGLPSPGSGSRASKEIFDSLNASATTSPDLVQLQVAAYSRDQAEAVLQACFKELAAVHHAMFEPTVDGMKRQLDSTTARLADAQRDYDRSYRSLRPSSGPGNATFNDSREVLVTNMATQLSAQILRLKEQEARLQQTLNPLYTYPTRVVEVPYAPLAPKSPSTALLVAAGAVAGMLAAAALLIGAAGARAKHSA